MTRDIFEWFAAFMLPVLSIWLLLRSLKWARKWHRLWALSNPDGVWERMRLEDEELFEQRRMDRR